MNKKLGVLICGLLLLGSIGNSVSARQDTTKTQTPSLLPTLSELSKLKADNLNLKTQLTQCQVDMVSIQARVASSTLTDEQSKLIVSFRDELKCGKTDGFDWKTLTCTKVSDVKKN